MFSPVIEEPTSDGESITGMKIKLEPGQAAAVSGGDTVYVKDGINWYKTCKKVSSTIQDLADTVENFNYMSGVQTWYNTISDSIVEIYTQLTDGTFWKVPIGETIVEAVQWIKNVSDHVIWLYNAAYYILGNTKSSLKAEAYDGNRVWCFGTPFATSSGSGYVLTYNQSFYSYKAVAVYPALPWEDTTVTSRKSVKVLTAQDNN